LDILHRALGTNLDGHQVLFAMGINLDGHQVLFAMRLIGTILKKRENYEFF
jgi:hypothetical protein